MTKWILEKTDKGVRMNVKFKRMVTSELLTTYMPSLLLILTTYATTFFKPFYFEAAVTVNLTTMLVMTTIFTGLMDKLPPTAYVKMIDIWLIGGQLIPFVEVVLLTIIEMLREGDGSGVQTLNHHGQERLVQVNPPSISATPLPHTNGRTGARAGSINSWTKELENKNWTKEERGMPLMKKVKLFGRLHIIMPLDKESFSRGNHCSVGCAHPLCVLHLCLHSFLQ